MAKRKSRFIAMLFGGIFFLALQGCAAGIVYCRGNQFGSDKEVIELLKKKYPGIKKIISIKRNFYDYSIIVAKDESGKTASYCLDTSIMLDHEFKECDK